MTLAPPRTPSPYRVVGVVRSVTGADPCESAKRATTAVRRARLVAAWALTELCSMSHREVHAYLELPGSATLVGHYLRRPRPDDDLVLVAAILERRRCPHCAGAGYVEP